MVDDFVLKEKELIKQNQQLELKTREILGKVEDAKKFQENYQMKTDLKLDAKYFSHLPTLNLSSKDLNLPCSVEQMGTKGMLQFYKAKIKTIQDEFEKQQKELKTKTEELSKLQKAQQLASDAKEKWFLQCNQEKNNNTKLEKQLVITGDKLQLKENENMLLRKEVERMKNDLKNTTNDLSASENRLQRAMQEIDKIKTQLKNVRQEEKETRDAYKNNIRELTATVQQIQKHKNELLIGYKKQIQLIDILKRQKAHMEQAKLLDIAEVDFMKLLDWKLD